MMFNQQQQQQLSTASSVEAGGLNVEQKRSAASSFSPKAAKIHRIFITHMHGDHVLGLVPLLCHIAAERANNVASLGGAGKGGNATLAKPLVVVGPPGVRRFVRRSLALTRSRVVDVTELSIVELVGLPLAVASQRLKSVAADGVPLSKEAKDALARIDRMESATEALAAAEASSPPSPAEVFDVPLLRSWPFEANDTWTTVGAALRSGAVAPVQPAASRGAKSSSPLDFDLAPDENGVYHIACPSQSLPGSWGMKALPLAHTIPSLAYVFSENARPAAMRSDDMRAAVERNFGALSAAGMQHPLQLLRTIKNLQAGDSLTLPDGTRITQEDAVGDEQGGCEIRGRKFVVMGDNCGFHPSLDAAVVNELCHGADMLVHEATVESPRAQQQLLPGEDAVEDEEHAGDAEGGATAPSAVLRSLRASLSHVDIADAKACIRGHATPRMAGAMAKRLGARSLLLTHFSPRVGNSFGSPEGAEKMLGLELAAREAAGAGFAANNVRAAWDFFTMDFRGRAPIHMPEHPAMAAIASGGERTKTHA